MKRRFFLLLLGVLLSATAFSHGSGSIHVKEMYSVLPFASTEYGTATHENRPVTDWLSLITGKLIDNYKGDPDPAFNGMCFYDYLKQEFGFACKHRLLFHWGFNSRPWSEFLDAKIAKYPWSSDPSEVARFKQVLVTEQKRRNGLANKATEDVFGFASSGTEAAWANGIIAVMYDVHLLGDYVLDDNKDFDGVTPPSAVVGDIIHAVRRIDPDSSKDIERKLTAASKGASDEHDRASRLIVCLQEEFPAFLLQADGGSLKRRFVAQGYTFR